jgi:DNA-directed RNA polymerase subunit beta
MPNDLKAHVKNNDRRYFTDFREAMPIPDLIELQKDSYKWFLEEGLAELFDEISPIVDFNNRELELSLGDYYLDKPKFNEIESREKNITYEAPLRIKAILKNKKSAQEISQEVYLGDFPFDD